MVLDLTKALLNTGTIINSTSEFEMTTLSSNMGDFTVLRKEPIVISALSSKKKTVHIESDIHIVLGIPCARCLDEVETSLNFQICKDIYFDVESITEDMEDQSFVDGNTIDIDKMLYNEILLNIPIRVLCKDTCKGICAKCGMNLNNGSCKCDTFVPDPRMSVISDIFKNFGDK